MSKQNARVIARAVALLWAGLWIYFAVASVLAESGNAWQKTLICLSVAGIFVGSNAVAWWSERVDGILLTLEGITLCIANFTFFHNPPTTTLLLLLTLGLPPSLAGMLFLNAGSPSSVRKP